jgi:hypothetical protein
MKMLQPVRVKGSANQVSVKAVPRIKMLHAFVGLGDLNTSAEELITFLSADDLEEVRCRKLKQL